MSFVPALSAALRRPHLTDAAQLIATMAHTTAAPAQPWGVGMLEVRGCRGGANRLRTHLAWAYTVPEVTVGEATDRS